MYADSAGNYTCTKTKAERTEVIQGTAPLKSTCNLQEAAWQHYGYDKLKISKDSEQSTARWFPTAARAKNQPRQQQLSSPAELQVEASEALALPKDGPSLHGDTFIYLLQVN